MYPAAGVIIWIFLGGMIGWLTGKLTATSNPHGTMANCGVAIVASIVAGFATSVVFDGEHSSGGFWAGIAIALVAACAAVAVFRLFYPGRVPTLR